MRSWRCPWWGYVLAVVVGVYLLYGLVSAPVIAAASQGWGAAVLAFTSYATGLGCVLATLAREQSRATSTVLLAVTVVAGLGVHWLVPYSGIALLYAATWVAPFRARLWQAGVVTALAVAGFVLLSLRLGLPMSSVFGVPSGLPWALAFGVILNQLATVRRTSAEIARVRAREAVLGERQRLAREIHDILAHSLSAQTVHLEGARLLLERDGDRELVLDRVIRAGDLARSGLVETRRAVEALRGDQPPLNEQLDRLAGEFSAASGAPCEVEILGDPEELSPEAQLTVARTTQEALANVHKHAPGAPVSVGLRRSGQWWELRVRDSGGSPGALTGTGGGYGLAGLRERAELLGGELDAGSEEPGFLVRLRVPA